MQTENEKCEIEVTLNVLEGKWKALILWYLIDKKYRFNEIKHLVDGISQKVLTQQLRELEADGLIHREIYPEVPARVEYSLTAYGRTLIPVLNVMAQWGLEHELDAI